MTSLADADLSQLVDEWLAELTELLGAIEGPVDPRFVDGVIVSTARS